MAFRILLVEDEEHLNEAIKLNLELDGHLVNAVNDGKKALEAFRQERFDLIVLDVMLPELDGFRVCEIIRLENTDIPILFLTAKNSSEDKINGLKKGADDYLVKPFNLEELLLRIRILLKRSEKRTLGDKPQSLYHFGANIVNFSTHLAKGADGVSFQLTKKEVLLLKLLIERKNEVVSRETILETVWGYDVYPSTRTIDNFILTFRKYFEMNPKESRFFHSIRGIGYKFTP